MTEAAIKAKHKVEFGDFQTPPELALKVCEVLSQLEIQPRTAVEPTCGVGNFVTAAAETFSTADRVLGFDISVEHTAAAKAKFADNRICIEQVNFFVQNWTQVFARCAEPILVIGNPPWVTNSCLGAINGTNTPVKTNFQSLNGLDALTGKSNFDVSEWILIRLFEALKQRSAVLAMLCKTSVARKLFVYAEKKHVGVSDFSIRRIDALHYFGASTDACLLTCRFGGSAGQNVCKVFDGLDAREPSQIVSTQNDQIIASLEKYNQWKHLNGGFEQKWRSGVKHDCAKVFELVKEGDEFRNGFGELVDLESDYVFPLLKSSDISNGTVDKPRKWLLVTQKSIRDDTAGIAEIAPKTWNYLVSHAALLDKRKSSIYKNRTRFAVFGVGDYSFSKWKIAISGLYKKLCFRAVKSFEEKPIMLDDTCYFLPCESEETARLTVELLNSEISREFYEAFIFWDAKRPITVEILNKLNLFALKQEMEKL